MVKILFLCSQNKLRSPTAEAIFCNVDGWDVRSAGLNKGADIPVSSEDVEWADVIFVMEQAHKRKLQTNFKESIINQRIICLGIPDNFKYMDNDLIRILEAKAPRYI